MDATKLIQQALAHHQAGSLDEARKVYERVLRRRPKDHVVLHLLGLVLCSAGDSRRGLQLIRRAIAIFPRYPEALSNLGTALQQLGRHEEALASFDKALAITPESAKALTERAAALNNLGRFKEAIADFDIALTIKPDFAEAFNGRGTALRNLGRIEEALTCFDNALAIRPDFWEALNNRGNLLQTMSMPEQALDSHDRALAIKRDFAALNNRGTALLNLGRFEEALASFDDALTIKPDHVKTLSNRGCALQNLGRVEQALATFEKALAIKPDDSDLHFHESQCHLLAGDFSRGWQKYEWRWQTEQMKRGAPNFPVPLWLGQEEISGKTVLLQAEQGFGDTLQFCRYANILAARGASVILAVQPQLRTLLQSLRGATHVVTQENDTWPGFDFYCPLMSLPLAFGTRIETIPADVPYLGANNSPAAKWRARLADFPGPKVGLVWAGSSQKPAYNLMDWRRSLRWEQVAPLCAIEGLTLVSLQKGERAPRTLTSELVDWTDELGDFSDTAALVAALDLVISVDTSVAHLAGALGKPVWLLNRFDSCWRWLVAREDSPWYPTMRLFNQPSPGNWESVMAEVTHELRHLIRDGGI